MSDIVKAEALSYSFPEKELYHKVSFTIEEGQHVALIGSNGTGKTTLIDMIINGEEYLYTGKLLKKEKLTIGYVSQYVAHDKAIDSTVYDYLCEDFLAMLKEQEDICKEMETAIDFDEIMERYQNSLDAFTAVDGDHYETNIRKQLKLAGLDQIGQVSIADISGGEYKLVQIIRQMMKTNGLLIMDEPDVFLDFENMNGLKNLITSYKGTILVITHNRYLLNNCFNKILHLENADIQEYEGSYMEYQMALLTTKVQMQEQAHKDQEEIERQKKVVDRIRKEATYIDNSGKGRQLKARVSFLERLEARAIKPPFVEVREPQIVLQKKAENTEEDIENRMTEELAQVEYCEIETIEPEAVTEIDTVSLPAISVENYKLAFDQILLDDVTFALEQGDKVALVGANGTGKTTLLREIYETHKDNRKIGYLSQIYGNLYEDKETVWNIFERLGFDTKKQAQTFLEGYCFGKDVTDQLVNVLSGGERNLLQLAILNQTETDILLLDEPTSHLDTYAQVALEKAIRAYPGTILMVSHDFYTIANCVDSVLYVEDKTIRKMSARAFRKKFYKDYFDSEYVEREKKKTQMEQKIQLQLKNNEYEKAKKSCEELAGI